MRVKINLTNKLNKALALDVKVESPKTPYSPFASFACGEGFVMSITKKIRFEVFKRDGFRCGYCGQEPPNVVLEVDHIEPKSKGAGR